MNLDQLLRQYASLALGGIERPYPYHLTVVFQEPRRISHPSEVHPVFYGCFDWHSAVHGHWLLAFAAEKTSDNVFSDQCISALGRTLLVPAVESEVTNLLSNRSFERPYGLAWMLMLSVELDRSSIEPINELGAILGPLVDVAYKNLDEWLPKLSHPVRTGTHNQTAFSMKLALDWANHFKHDQASTMIKENARRFFEDDHALPVHMEPSGEDFLSPSLSEAWLLASVFDEVEFASWFYRAFPTMALIHSLQPVVPADRKDGRLVHLDGLNLSRSWMLAALAVKLGSGHQEFETLRRSSLSHGRAGLQAALSTEYMASHWLGTFAAYLLMEVEDFFDSRDFF